MTVLIEQEKLVQPAIKATRGSSVSSVQSRRDFQKVCVLEKSRENQNMTTITKEPKKKQRRGQYQPGDQIIPFFSYSREVRKIICATNAIENINRQLRKVIKNRGHFPNDESATKLIYLAL